MKIRIRTALLGIIFSAPCIDAVEPVDYQTDIAPLLRDYCAGCHNEGDYEGAFSVETFRSLMEGGESEDKTILVPGDSGRSYLHQTLLKTVRPGMPPKREPQLEEAELALFTRWIEEGAKGPDPEKDLSLLSSLTVPAMEPSDSAARPVTALAFSPDGERLAVASFGSVELRAAVSGEVMRRIEISDGKVNAVHFSRDGSRLAVATGITGLKGIAEIREVETGDLLLRVGEGVHRDILFDAEMSPDGTVLATAGYDETIRIWDVASGDLLREMPSHNGAVYDLAFSPDGTVLASASGDSTGKLWHVETGERLDTLNQPQAEQYRIDFTPDGKYLIGVGADNRIRLWRFVSRDRPELNPVAQSRFGHEEAIVEMAVSADGKWLATSSADRALKRWSLPGLESAGVAAPQPDVVSALAFGAVNELTVARLDGSLAAVTFPEPGSGERKLAAGGGGVEASNRSGRVDAGKKESELATLALGDRVEGVLSVPGEFDEFAFHAAAGENWIFEIEAARVESPLDSHLLVLDEAGEAVERVVLQAVRDSWLTFRGKDSETSGDFRVHNWSEMELNEYLYVNGEVVKLWLYPRGPDSGFLVYPGFGSRHTYFGTTAMAHPLGQPCYIVRALPPGSDPSPNGLPTYRIYYENDDDPRRELGSDSRLHFVAPEQGLYRLRVGDVRGFGGEDYSYALTAREPAPDFSVAVDGKAPKISPGSAKEIVFTAERKDGYSGPIEIAISGLPEQLAMPERVVIEAEQYRAFATIHAAENFAGLTEEEAKKIRMVASALIGDRTLEKSIGDLGVVEKAQAAKVRVAIQADGAHGEAGDDGMLEFVIEPGETITALAVAERIDFDGVINFGKEDAGRNLPHGLYVDNIGLNGLMIQEGRSEQRFFITAAPWVADTVREFHLKTTADGNQASLPVRIRVQSGRITQAP